MVKKFKVWDKEKKKWIKYFSINSEGSVFDDEYSDEPNKNAVLIEYLNFKDKNGKEIYEGDIVQDNSGKIFIQGLCCAEKIIKQPTSAITDFQWQEVIGNIYENPELLNKQ